MKGRSVIYFKEMAHAVTESGKAAGRGQQAGDTSRATVAVEAWRPNHWTARAIPRPPSLIALPFPLSQAAVRKQCT